MEDEAGALKVLESHEVMFRNSIGISIYKTCRTFKGFLTEDDHVGRTIEKDSILTLLQSSLNMRDQLLILLLSETGFRIGELLGVRYGSDIDYRRHTIMVQNRETNENGARAKNAEYRKALISDGAMRLLILYLSKYAAILKKGYLFVVIDGRNAGKPLCANDVYAILRRLEKRTGIKATPHMLRHYFANERRKSGWDIALISKALGHKKISTTERYLDIDSEEIEEAAKKYYEETGSLFDAEGLI